MTQTDLHLKASHVSSGPKSGPTGAGRPATVERARTYRLLGILGAALAAGLVASAYLPVEMAMVAGLAIFCIGLWASGAVPEYWPALALFLIAMVFHLAPAETVFSGFHSSTFWLLFSGAVMGAAIRHTGLGKRAAALLSARLSLKYSRIIGGIIIFSIALAFVMPSGLGRVVLLMPMVLAVADHLGYGAGSRGRQGILLAAAFGAFLPSFAILPSNAPNMILAGMAETLYGLHLSYWSYLLLHFPVLGLLKALALFLLILFFFPDRDPAKDERGREDETPISGPEKQLCLLLGLCLVLWLSDGLHHVSPAWVGLAAALYCLWPKSGLTSKTCLKDDIAYGALFFVAGVIGLGALISSTGLGEVLVAIVSQHLGFSEGMPVWNVIALTLTSICVSLIANLAGVPAVMTPVAQELSGLTGLSMTAVLMTQVLAFSSVFLPYQAPPLIFAMQTAQLPVGAVNRLCLALFAISLLVLIPIDLVWWRILGVI